jgi:hypothetical protein
MDLWRTLQRMAGPEGPARKFRPTIVELADRLLSGLCEELLKHGARSKKSLMAIDYASPLLQPSPLLLERASTWFQPSTYKAKLGVWLAKTSCRHCSLQCNFWGVKIPPGEEVEVAPEYREDFITSVHLTQVTWAGWGPWAGGQPAAALNLIELLWTLAFLQPMAKAA